MPRAAAKLRSSRDSCADLRSFGCTAVHGLAPSMRSATESYTSHCSNTMHLASARPRGARPQRLRALLHHRCEPIWAMLRHLSPRNHDPPPRQPRSRIGIAAKLRAARALGVRDGLSTAAPKRRRAFHHKMTRRAAAGRSGRRGPTTITDWTGARDKLLVALQRSEANDAVVDGRYVDLSGASVYLKSRGDLDVRTGNFSSRKMTPQFTRGDGRDADRRLAKLRQRCGFEEIVVLRNRRRAFGVGESAFDSYGRASFFDQSDAACSRLTR